MSDPSQGGIQLFSRQSVNLLCATIVLDVMNQSFITDP